MLLSFESCKHPHLTFTIKCCYQISNTRSPPQLFTAAPLHVLFWCVCPKLIMHIHCFPIAIWLYLSSKKMKVTLVSSNFQWGELKLFAGVVILSKIHSFNNDYMIYPFIQLVYVFYWIRKHMIVTCYKPMAPCATRLISVFVVCASGLVRPAICWSQQDHHTFTTLHHIKEKSNASFQNKYLIITILKGSDLRKSVKVSIALFIYT